MKHGTNDRDLNSLKHLLSDFFGGAKSTRHCSDTIRHWPNGKKSSSLGFVLLIALFGSNPSLAQAVEDERRCEAILNSPHFQDLLWRDQGEEFWRIASDKLGKALLGVQCSKQQITDYFESAGWEFSGETIGYSVNGPPSSQFERDHVLAYCRPRRFPWRLILYRCNATAGVSILEGKITHISAGANK